MRVLHSALQDLTCELDRLGEMDQSNVITDAQSVVVLVGEDLIGGDLQSSVLNSLPEYFNFKMISICI